MTGDAAREVRRSILALALPLMVSNVSQTLMSLVDTAMVGHLGETELAAMGPAGVVFLILFLVLTSSFMGIQALTARRSGEGNDRACGRVLNSGLVLAVVIGIGAGALGRVFGHDLSALVAHVDGASRVAELAGDYLTIRWQAIAVVTVLFAFKGFYYGLGITRIDLVLTLVMNLLNVFLNWVFIYGRLGAPEMGMPGAAISTVIATALSAAVYLLYSLRPTMRARYGLYTRANTGLDIIGRILGLSAPRAVQALAFGGSMVFFRLVAERCGETALAASTVVWRIFGFNILISIALGAAAATLVGQSLGAKNPDRAEESGRVAARYGVIINVAVGIVILCFTRPIIGLFTDETPVIEAAVGPLRLLGVFQAVDAVGIIYGRVLAAAGQTVYVMLAELLAAFGALLPAAFFLTAHFPDDLAKVWLTWIVYILVWYFAMARRFQSGTWKRVQI